MSQPREDITLVGTDAEWWREKREAVAEKRGGREPGNAELARLLMQESDL